MIDAKKEVDIHLAEYQALRAEADHYSQRIDRMSGVYLTAMFGIAGYLLRPESQFDIDAYLKAVQESATLTALCIFLAVLNSVLLIRIGSFFSGLLAITQYVHYVIRPRLIDAVEKDVLRWDEAPRLSAKRIWIPLRSMGQSLFVILAESISVTVMISSLHVFSMHWLMIALYFAAWVFLLASVASLIA
ncbi:MAG: hypothetical protein MI920_07410, partial [Kiloniellales bacterium]|nr:hypothetical protein [Kiloniellales bacterium]